VLAADSAATIEGRAGTKIYHSENKLFNLSKYRPIGVMIYNSVHLCGVPWETIIKEYRKQFIDKKFDTLTEYADDFIGYLNNNTYLFPLDQYVSDSTHTVARVLREIKEDHDAVILHNPGQNKMASLATLLQEKIAQLEKANFLIGFDVPFEIRFRRHFSQSIRVLAETVFSRKRFPRTVSLAIERYVVLCFTRKLNDAGTTGVVLAGFGERDVFPRLRCFSIESVVLGRLKMVEGRAETISLDNPATWRSFARSEVVASIIGGIHPTYRANFLRGALRLVHDNVMAALTEITELNAAQRQAYETTLTQRATEAWVRYFDEMDAFARNRFEDPVRRSLDGLGKDDLAKIAESLVSITSFRQQISPEEETVGGPIDVAVISKGDGFIWIKRKFYFDAKFNPHFIERYYRDA